MFAQFPSPHFWTAANSSMSSAADHGFLFLRGGKLPLPEPFVSNTSVEVATTGSGCLWTETGTVMLVPLRLLDCGFSDEFLVGLPLGIFIVNGASMVNPFSKPESDVEPEAMSTWRIQPVITYNQESTNVLLHFIRKIRGSANNIKLKVEISTPIVLVNGSLIRSNGSFVYIAIEKRVESFWKSIFHA